MSKRKLVVFEKIPDEEIINHIQSIGFCFGQKSKGQKTIAACCTFKRTVKRTTYTHNVDCMFRLEFTDALKELVGIKSGYGRVKFDRFFDTEEGKQYCIDNCWEIKHGIEKHNKTVEDNNAREVLMHKQGLDYDKNQRKHLRLFNIGYSYDRCLKDGGDMMMGHANMIKKYGLTKAQKERLSFMGTLEDL